MISGGNAPSSFLRSFLLAFQSSMLSSELLPLLSISEMQPQLRLPTTATSAKEIAFVLPESRQIKRVGVSVNVSWEDLCRQAGYSASRSSVR